MKKIINIGTVPNVSTREEVYCSIEIRNGNLSISGVIGPKKNGNAAGSCGQIDDTIRKAWNKKEISFSSDWNDSLLDEFLDTWKKWHLNDMRAGCEHQRRAGWDNSHIGEECQVCHYHYGTAWLKEVLPQNVIEFLESLPTSKKTPAWV